MVLLLRRSSGRASLLVLAELIYAMIIYFLAPARSRVICSSIFVMTWLLNLPQITRSKITRDKRPLMPAMRILATPKFISSMSAPRVLGYPQEPLNAATVHIQQKPRLVLRESVQDCSTARSQLYAAENALQNALGCRSSSTSRGFCGRSTGRWLAISARLRACKEVRLYLVGTN